MLAAVSVSLPALFMRPPPPVPSSSAWPTVTSKPLVSMMVPPGATLA